MIGRCGLCNYKYMLYVGLRGPLPARSQMETNRKPSRKFPHVLWHMHWPIRSHAPRQSNEAAHFFRKPLMCPKLPQSPKAPNCPKAGVNSQSRMPPALFAVPPGTGRKVTGRAPQDPLVFTPSCAFSSVSTFATKLSLGRPPHSNSRIRMSESGPGHNFDWRPRYGS